MKFNLGDALHMSQQERQRKATEKRLKVEKILGTRWFGHDFDVVGFVAVRGNSGYDWAAYCGVAPHDEPPELAEQRIARTGSKLPQSIAEAAFPDITLEYRQ